MRQGNAGKPQIGIDQASWIAWKSTPYDVGMKQVRIDCERHGERASSILYCVGDRLDLHEQGIVGAGKEPGRGGATDGW